MTSYLSISHLILKRKMQCKDCKFFYNNFPLVIMNRWNKSFGKIFEYSIERWKNVICVGSGNEGTTAGHAAGN